MARMLDAKRYCACGTQILTKSNDCNYCISVARKRRRLERLAKGDNSYNEYNKRWREKNVEKYLFQTCKARAKSRDHEFNLTLEDIVVPAVCPVLGIPLFVQAGQGASPNSPSIDRIDSNKGYVKGNIQVISWRANHLKTDGSLEEFELLTEFLRNAKKE